MLRRVLYLPAPLSLGNLAPILRPHQILGLVALAVAVARGLVVRLGRRLARRPALAYRLPVVGRARLGPAAVPVLAGPVAAVLGLLELGARVQLLALLALLPAEVPVARPALRAARLRARRPLGPLRHRALVLVDLVELGRRALLPLVPALARTAASPTVIRPFIRYSCILGVAWTGGIGVSY